ncbi:uncharacterized protein LOC131648130 [Vicia villosa]|uniref:uncharacterized protein LOC131648130 n=1 Tax=Vicia villosa TaxID=3911 RepID=UPI00273C54D0|nr:uncharacterized protein LOC131648130 [Vicia villosa]
MVLPFEPSKPVRFYGSSLPRPRIHVNSDGSDRVDPPLSVTGPLMSWAEEAHWSMGGLSFKRLRLMGKIEGNVEKLRTQREKEFNAYSLAHTKSPSSDLRRSKGSPSPSRSRSPPPAPFASKRRRLETLLEEEEEEEVRVSSPVTRGRRLVKKLGDDFDRVASPEKKRAAEVVVADSVDAPVKTRSRRLVKIGEAVKKVVEEKKKLKKKVSEEEEKSPVSGIRVSPRLAKTRSN